MKMTDHKCIRKMSTRINISSVLMLCTVMFTEAPAQTLEQLQEKAMERAEQALVQVNSIREEITTEKIPLGERLRELEASTSEKRREADRLERLRDNATGDFARMEEELKLRTDELGFVTGMLSDYLNRLNGSLHPSESELYSDELLRLLNLIDNESVDPEELITEQQKAIDIGLSRIGSLMGGQIFEGSAVVSDGSYVSGKFGIFGPSTYFASSDGKTGGVADRGASLAASVFEFDSGAIGSIGYLLNSGSGTIPVDTTLGRATAIATTNESIFQHIKKGGIWMFPILSFAAVAWLIALFKAFEILTVRRIKPGILLESISLVRRNEAVEADRLLKSQGGPTAKMLQKGVKYHKLPKDSLEELMAEDILETQPKLERGLSIITVTAAVAPLLGLLGTVTGMINTFKLITLFGTGDAKSLSSGISEALITTEFGLIVAIPSLLLSAFLSRQVQGISGEMENAAISFANGVGLPEEVELPKAS